MTLLVERGDRRLRRTETRDADQVSKKVMPQIPVTDTTCMSGKSPYCVFAMEVMVPRGPKEPRYSIIV